MGRFGFVLLAAIAIAISAIAQQTASSPALAGRSNAALAQISPQTSKPANGVLLNQRPVTLPMSAADSCKVTTLLLTFRTGNDDLRGGKNNLDVQIHFADGSMQTAGNVNHGANWPNNSLNNAEIPLKQTVAPNQIKSLTLVHLAQGGYNAPSAGQAAAMGTPVGPALAPIAAAQGVKSEDNWTMDNFQAFAEGPNKVMVPLASAGIHRFTASDPSLSVNTRSDATCSTPVNAVRELEFIFKTGNDDLRSDDAVGVTIRLADGSTQTAPNLNQGQRWADGSTHEGQVLLNRMVPIDQIKSITFATTSKTGMNSDNWNMESVEIRADGRLVTTYGFHRFSADWSGPSARELTVPIK